MVASEEEVEVDEIEGSDLRILFDTFPGLASRFYLSLSMILAHRLRATSKVLAHEMSMRDAGKTAAL